jgi:aryl-alcohol dehydrogenase-like predicted oxidoreductase
MLRSLGKTGLKVAPLVFGGNVLGWTIDEKTSFQVLDAFLDHGFNAIDTADVFPDGRLATRVENPKRSLAFG